MKKIMYIVGLAFIGVMIVLFYSSNKPKLSQNQNQNQIQNQNQVEEKVYVAVEGTGEIAIINAETQEKIKTIDLSEQYSSKKIKYMPHNVQVSPDNKSVWVTANVMENMEKMSFSFVQKAYADEGHGEENSEWNDQVIVIDPLTDTIIKRINLGKGIHLAHVSITPDSTYAIVAAQKAGVIYKINTNSFEIEKSVETKKNGGPHGLRVSVDGKSAYVAMFDGKSMGILNIENMKLADIPLKGTVVQTGVTPDGKYALASVYDPKSLAVYDIASKKINYVDLPEDAKGPVQLYPTPDSRYVYVADQGYYFDQPNGDTVYKIDLTEMKVVEAVKVGSAPHGIIVSKDGTFVYVTNQSSDDVSVIDTTTDKEIKKINVGKNPNGISIWYRNNL
jgi:YVTN family beta-propeller protein